LLKDFQYLSLVKIRHPILIVGTIAVSNRRPQLVTDATHFPWSGLLFMVYSLPLSVITYLQIRISYTRVLKSESLNTERRYSCRAMLNFEPVAPPPTGGISQINKSHLVVHMWLCTWVRWLKWIANTSTICYMITYSFITKHFNCAHMILKETKLWNCK